MELAEGDTMELDGCATGLANASGGGCGSSGGDVDDRLSALPDSLLHAIMSFLKARQAVQTCVLAKRWQHLWRSVPCLDVDLDEFRAVPKPSTANNNNPAPGDGVDDSDLEFDEEDGYSDDGDDDDNDNGTKDREWDNFEDFADILMHRRNIAMLDSLRLHVSKVRAPSFADKQAGGWLRRAMKYCVPDLPRQLDGSGATGSWRLRRLYLCNVALDGRFAQHVSSACWSLEELELEDCMCEIQAIFSCSLKSLVLRDCRWHHLSRIASPTLKCLAIDGGSNSPDCMLVITAPAIACLWLDVPLHFAKRVVVN